MNARARLVIGKRVRKRGTGEGFEAELLAFDERSARLLRKAQVERAAKRRLEDWQSQRWADAWTAAFAARRAETL